MATKREYQQSYHTLLREAHKLIDELMKKGVVEGENVVGMRRVRVQSKKVEKAGLEYRKNSIYIEE